MERLIFPVTKKEAEKQGKEYSSKANRDALFPSQLRTLREKKGISQAVLAHDLGVSKSTIGLYETGDTLPDAKTLRDLAEYFCVSSDYLLGLSAVASSDTSVRKICEYTGLTEETVEHLNTLSQLGPVVSSFLARFFEDVVVFNGTSIELMCDCIVKAAHAGAISIKNTTPRIRAEIDNIIDSMNGESDGQYRIPASDAEGFFLISAQNIAKSSIDGILDTMQEELKSEYLDGNFVESAPTKNIWRLFGDDNDFFE